MENIYCVKLVRMKLGAVFIEPVDEELRIFSSIEKVTSWLTDNGFIYGQRYFLNYIPKDYKEWFHKDDICMERVDVIITEMNVDDSSASKYKNFKEMHSEWFNL